MRPTTHAHQLIRERLQQGDTAIDATAGNGHDTLFLARTLRELGNITETPSVLALDLQAEAIASTHARLEEHALSSYVHLHEGCHSEIASLSSTHLNALPRVIMFNLGYLPGVAKSLITTASTTLPALKGALSILAPGGLITVVLYPGHEGGLEEQEHVLTWAKQHTIAQATHYPSTAPNIHPSLLTLTRKR